MAIRNLRLFLHFSPNGGRSLAGGCNSPVWNTACCIWYGQVEGDALGRFNRTARLPHDLLVNMVLNVHRTHQAYGGGGGGTRSV